MDTQSREISSAWEAMVIAGGVVSAEGGVTRDVLTQKACRSHSSSIGSSQKELAGLLGTARCSEVFGHSRDKHANYVEANLWLSSGVGNQRPGRCPAAGRLLQCGQDSGFDCNTHTHPTQSATHRV